MLYFTAALAVANSAAAFPDRPLKLVVPLAAGGNIDVAARLLADRLGQQLGQRVIVENVPGAGGVIGGRTVATAPADGHTLLFQGASQASIPFTYKKLTYDGVRDFTGVSLVARYPVIAVINAKLPATDLAEFLALVRANPGKYSFGSSGIGGSSHIMTELLKLLANVDMVHVPFRGNAPAATALISGQIDLLLDGVSAQRGYIEDGRVRVLGLTTKEPSPLLPDVRPMADAVAGYDIPMWLAVFAPAQTPKPIVDRLSAEITAAMKDETLRKRYADMYVEPTSSTPAELDAYFRDQLAFYQQLVKSANISVAD
jgi:tripartite-type tricarboxylate transporter receptor subunit TctC